LYNYIKGGGVIMRLFHVSEEKNIKVFEPRIPSRKDLDQSKGVVWAISEERLMNFLTPRNCPRVVYHKRSDSTLEDTQKYMGKRDLNAVMAIEYKWFKEMINTKLYIYEFDTENFEIQDENAGYYISYETENPINVVEIDDLFQELFNRNVEVRLVPSIWYIFDDIKESSLGYSMCRMGFAQEREK